MNGKSLKEEGVQVGADVDVGPDDASRLHVREHGAQLRKRGPNAIPIHKLNGDAHGFGDLHGQGTPQDRMKLESRFIGGHKLDVRR